VKSYSIIEQFSSQNFTGNRTQIPVATPKYQITQKSAKLLIYENARRYFMRVQIGYQRITK